MWRTSTDIGDSWLRVMHNLDTLVGAGMQAKPGQWNDPGLLTFVVLVRFLLCMSIHVWQIFLRLVTVC